MQSQQRVSEVLSVLVPFRFLSAQARKRLITESKVISFEKGVTIIEQGSDDDDSVYILLSGSVESLDHTRRQDFRVNVIESGNYFGERRAVFDQKRTYEARALENCECLIISGDCFRNLLSLSRPFAQAFGSVLREGQGIFAAFERFNAELIRFTALGHIELRKLIDLYKALKPALHPLLDDETQIDFSALAYAVRRLPANVSRTFMFLCTDDLPVVYASPELLFPFVPTDSRHRFIYEMLSGKDMVLVRSGLSDLMDFVTCLCAFAIETRKIRYRLNHPDLVRTLSDYVSKDAETRELGRDFMGKLPFSEAEREKLFELWGDDVPSRIHEITFHRQAFSVDIRKQTNNYNSRLSEIWTRQVGEAARSLTGISPSDFESDFEVHIISSNTHSVSNCLNPFFASHAEDIFAWADKEKLRTDGWNNPYDELYSLTRSYLEAFPERKQELKDDEKLWGIVRLPETVTTGIQVQLIDTDKICNRPIDPLIKKSCSEKKSLIVNIDYAFGEQAEDIMRSLLMLFGPNVASISILGKAGSLIGKRGDILIPSAFIEQKEDMFMPIPTSRVEEAKNNLTSQGHSVHAGPMLTVGGTLLQNRMMLHFYKQIWSCIGLEMEGVYYDRAIVESRELGVLNPKAERSYFYYVSDLPLETGSNLSERLRPQEGIPPLYAITREVLSRILTQ